MNNKNKILALLLVILIIILGGASLYISAKINTQQAIAPNAPESKPKAFECVEACPGTDGLLHSCHPKDTDGSSQDSICNTAGRVETCGPNTTPYCCPAPGGTWTTDMSKCPIATLTSTTCRFACAQGTVCQNGQCVAAVSATVWTGSAACTVIATATNIVCEPTQIITCSPDCPTACSTAASTINTCTDSCGNAKTKQCAATAACGTADVSISKTAYKDETGNTAGVYTLTREIDSVSKNQVFIYAITIKNNGTATASSVVITDPLTGQHQDLLTEVDQESRCTFSSSDKKLTCIGLTLTPGASTTLTFRLKVSDGASNGDVIKNFGTVTYNGNSKQAEKDLNISTIVSCNNTCTTDAECSNGLTCDTTANKCRKPACAS